MSETGAPPVWKLNTDAKGTERRLHKRYRVKHETFAFLGEETGTIVDISKGGMSFHFAFFEKDPVNPSYLALFIAETRFYLPKIPVFLVGEVQTVHVSIFSLLRMKRLSLKFGSLSRDQHAGIEKFIACNTIEK
jgi:hypothetical protein